jgi:outer membrane protein assembly factor BamB
VLKCFRSLLLIVALLPAFPVAQAANAAAMSDSASTSSPSISVTTYHYDTLRTGWNRNETVLSALKFPATFGVLQTVALDDQVDAQPLLVPAQLIAGGPHDVLYVVTENNSVYALDANSGAILVQRNLGAPVPTPLGCGNNGPNVGITSTPVIDLKNGEIFVMAYLNGSTPSYQLHALNLTTLADAMAPVTVAATQTLTDGTTFAFNATYQRQRPGLLEMNGLIYAGFGSFCDFSASQSRGWVLGWNAANLAPLAHAELNDSQATSPTSFFLSSVWMSGFGVAGTDNEVFFSTGNSDCNFYVSPEACPPQSTYDGVTNLQESVVSLQRNLAQRDGVFTPTNVFTMDMNDADLGAGGVLLVPTSRVTGGLNLATIVSKNGRLFLLNRDNLSTALDTHQLADGCWCGPSFFYGSDGIGRVVISAGSALQTWQIQTSPAPHLVAEATAYVQQSVQDRGFFTVVSSYGERLYSAIIWAVARPTASAPLTLYAFAAKAANGTFKQLYSAPAGQWPNLGGNANIVPVVANGKVYVAAYKSLMIFGPNGSPATAAVTANSVDSTPVAASLPPGVTQRVSGMLLTIDGTTLTLLTRTSRTVKVDVAHAVESEQVANLIVGQAYTALAAPTGSNGTLQAVSVMRAKLSSSAWPKDQW